MKLRDFATQLYIDPAKLITYALNKRHSKGKHKARVFEAVLGYSTEDYQHLLDQIKSQALEAEAIVQRVDQYGQHLQVDLRIKGLADQQAIVRTGWIVDPGSETASLSTLYVLGASRYD